MGLHSVYEHLKNDTLGNFFRDNFEKQGTKKFNF